jgi:hypothetical protein
MCDGGMGRPVFLFLALWFMIVWNIDLLATSVSEARRAGSNGALTSKAGISSEVPQLQPRHLKLLTRKVTTDDAAHGQEDSIARLAGESWRRRDDWLSALPGIFGVFDSIDGVKSLRVEIDARIVPVHYFPFPIPLDEYVGQSSRPRRRIASVR